MLIQFDHSGLQQTRWHEYASRFFMGGLVTVFTGIISHRFGPVIGGVFLAFPAIFSASTSLIEKHQREKKESKGISGTERGRKAAAVEAAGAALGTIGLIIFALIAWKLMPLFSPWLVLVIGTLAWAVTTVFAWLMRKRGIHFFHRGWSWH